MKNLSGLISALEFCIAQTPSHLTLGTWIVLYLPFVSAAAIPLRRGFVDHYSDAFGLW